MRQGTTFEELVFWCIYDQPQISRADLAARFSVSLPTVSRAIAVLLEHGLILETAGAASSPGRKPQLLQVNPKLALLVGVEIDLDRVRAVVTDFSGTLLGRGAVACDAREGLNPAIEASRAAVDQALADAGVSWQKINHLGIGHPGDLDLSRGVCVSWANAPGWSGAPLRRQFQEKFRMEASIDDNSRALALAERHTTPADRCHPNAIYVLAGTGIGMGIFIEGRLYRGSTRGGGEMGHTVIDPNGPPCKCGNRGCVEAFAGAGSIVRQFREAVRDAQPPSTQRPATPASVEQVIELAQQGDRTAQGVLGRAYEALGLGVANAVQILNPSLIVLCGRLARAAGDDLLEVVGRTVRRQCVATASRELAIRRSQPKKDISTIGCALVAAESEARRILGERLLRAATKAGMSRRLTPDDPMPLAAEL